MRRSHLLPNIVVPLFLVGTMASCGGDSLPQGGALITNKEPPAPIAKQHWDESCVSDADCIDGICRTVGTKKYCAAPCGQVGLWRCSDTKNAAYRCDGSFFVKSHSCANCTSIPTQDSFLCGPVGYSHILWGSSQTTWALLSDPCFKDQARACAIDEKSALLCMGGTWQTEEVCMPSEHCSLYTLYPGGGQTVPVQECH